VHTRSLGSVSRVFIHSLVPVSFVLLCILLFRYVYGEIILNLNDEKLFCRAQVLTSSHAPCIMGIFLYRKAPQFMFRGTVKSDGTNTKTILMKRILTSYYVKQISSIPPPPPCYDQPLNVMNIRNLIVSSILKMSFCVLKLQELFYRMSICISLSNRIFYIIKVRD
jgi:hypothetical protein